MTTSFRLSAAQMSALILIFMLCSISSRAQNNCELCQSVLLGGVFNEHHESFKNDFESDLQLLFSKDFEHWDSIEKSKNAQLQASGSYKVFSASAKGAKSTSEKKQEFDRLREEYSKSDLQKKNVVSTLAQKSASKHILDTWLGCIQNNCGKEKLLSKIVGGPEEYIINLTYTPTDGSDPDVIAVNSISIVPSSTEQIGGSLLTEKTLRKFETASIVIKKKSKDIDVNASIAVQSFGNISIPIKGTPLVTFDAKENRNSYDGMPIGTVISSLIDFETFSTMVDQSPYQEPSKIKWVPADGRPISGSIFHSLTQNKNIPDLRGVFMRGLNTFSSQNLQRSNDRKYDPNDKRVAGDYQADNVGQHNHTLPALNVVIHAPYAIAEYDGGLGKGPVFADGTNGVGRKQLGETVTAGNEGDTEARPINVAVYYYVKIN